jgi:undecaprenol kinase
LRTAWLTQPTFRIQAAAVVPVVVAGALLHLPPGAWAVLVVAIGLVLFAELLNTAVEAVVDLVSPDYHPLAKQAKDVAAAAVLVSAVTAVAAGAAVVAWAVWRS